RSLLVDDLGIAGDTRRDLLDAIGLPYLIDERRIDTGPAFAEAQLELGRAAHVRIGSGVGIGQHIVQRATDRVGQHQSSRQKRNAQKDGGGGGEEPQLLGGELLDGEAQHWNQSPSFLMRSRTELAVGASISSTMRP